MLLKIISIKLTRKITFMKSLTNYFVQQFVSVVALQAHLALRLL